FSFDKFGGLTYAFSDVPGLRSGVAGTINFLSDLSAPAPFSSGLGPRHAKQQIYLSYFQFSRNFKIVKFNGGMRYDYFGAVSERDDRAVIIDPSTGQTVTDTKSFFSTDKLNFQPRIGIQYLNLKHSLALRAG